MRFRYSQVKEYWKVSRHIDSHSNRTDHFRKTDNFQFCPIFFTPISNGSNEKSVPWKAISHFYSFRCKKPSADYLKPDILNLRNLILKLPEDFLRKCVSIRSHVRVIFWAQKRVFIRSHSETLTYFFEWILGLDKLFHIYWFRLWVAIRSKYFILSIVTFQILSKYAILL